MFKVEALNKYEDLPLPTKKNNCFSWMFYFEANYTDETKHACHGGIVVI